jgi:hypothetical protein
MTDFSESEPVNIKPGEEWLVVTCRGLACREPLLIEAVTPLMLDEDGVLSLPAGTFEVKCHRCGLLSFYGPDEVRVETKPLLS